MHFIIRKSIVPLYLRSNHKVLEHNGLWIENIIIHYRYFLKRFSKVYDNYLYFGNIDRIKTSVNYEKCNQNYTGHLLKSYI